MTVAATALRRLDARLRGAALLPGDDGYAEVRKPVVGPPGEALPAAVARCAEVGDVVEALGFARSHGLRFALRSGGHSFAEHSSTGGLLIDLGGMAGAACHGETASVGPGSRLGALAARLAAHDRMVPCGWCRGVGVAGAALGGGYGVFGRRHGLGCDHLVAVEVALADGRVVRADADREPELFWALRGAGGGSFGAVTSLVFRTRPVVAAARFQALWAPRRAAAVIDAWQRWAPYADPDVNAECALVAGDDPTAAPIPGVFGVVVGGRGHAADLLRGFEARVGAAPERVAVAELSGREAAQWCVDPDHTPSPLPPHARPGLRVVRSGFFGRPLPQAAVAALVDGLAAGRTSGQYRDLEFVPWGGAYGSLRPDATAFPHRGARFLLKHTAQVGSRASDQTRSAAREWVARSWRTARPHGTGGAYANYPDPDLADWARAYYGENLPRLRRAKAAYDPENLFRHAQSIPPPGLRATDA